MSHRFLHEANHSPNKGMHNLRMAALLEFGISNRRLYAKPVMGQFPFRLQPSPVQLSY